MNNMQEVASELEREISSILPGVVCIAQEWDNRIDCVIKLPNGTVAGEMISAKELTADRIKATVERLKLVASGEPVQLVNAIWRPLRLNAPNV